MAIVGGEEIELEVLRTLVADVLAVDHHPEVEIPLRDVQGVEEAGDVRRHGEPALPLGGELLQGQPAPVPDLDGIGTAPGSQQAEHGALAAGGRTRSAGRRSPPAGTRRSARNHARCRVDSSPAGYAPSGRPGPAAGS